MKAEVERLKFIKSEERGIFEIILDGKRINGVKEYKLASSEENGEPELTLVLNVKDFRVLIE